MTTYNTGNPLGSADPRDLYDNAENLDEAVNDLNSDTWIDRFGVERPSLALLEQLRDAANAIVGGSEDITHAWRSAIRSDTGYRIADSALAYTGSLDEGSSTQRPPIPYEGNSTFLRGAGTGGAAFGAVAPAIVALRELIPLPSPGRLAVDIVSGVSLGSLNDDFFVGVAWYDSNKERLTGTPSTFRSSAPLSAGAYSDSFTVGLEGSGADIEAPTGAAYMTPYYGTDSTTGRFWAAELVVSTYIESADEVIYPLVGFEGNVGQSPIEYSHSTATGNVPPVPRSNVSYGSSGARITVIANSSRDTLALRGLLPVSPAGNLRYDVFCGLSHLQGSGTVEIGAAWFSSNLAFLSETVAKTFSTDDLTSAVDTKVIRSRLFDTPPTAAYARPFVRVTGSSTQVAVLSLYSQSHQDLELYGESQAGHPANLLASNAIVHAYDPSSVSNISLGSSGVQSLRDDVSGVNFQYIGGTLARPSRDTIAGYPSIIPRNDSSKARLTTESAVVFSPPCTLVFAAYADGSVDSLRPLIHQN